MLACMRAVVDEDVACETRLESVIELELDSWYMGYGRRNSTTTVPTTRRGLSKYGKGRYGTAERTRTSD